ALFRVERVVVPRPAALAAGWLAGNAQHLSERAMRLGGVALAAPFALGLGDAAVGHRLAWAALRGTTVDRLRVLGEEYAETVLIPAIRPIAIDLIEQARRDGFEIVLISDHVEPIARPLADHLRADHLVANQLEVRGDRATGRLLDPVVARFGGAALRELADARGYDLARSRAFGGAGDDQLLLSAIGAPCVVHPDRQLRRVARDLDWPVVEGGS
ncbi:MAG: haloacid dehalogenase-like hydrolase, partial [Myxococcota bacterium]